MGQTSLSVFGDKKPHFFYNEEPHKEYVSISTKALNSIGRFRFNHQEYLIVKSTKNGFYGTLKVFDIHLFATTMAQLENELLEELEVLEKLYVQCDIEELSPSAMKLREALILNVSGWRRDDGFKR